MLIVVSLWVQCEVKGKCRAAIRLRIYTAIPYRKGVLYVQKVYQPVHSLAFVFM